MPVTALASCAPMSTSPTLMPRRFSSAWKGAGIGPRPETPVLVPVLDGASWTAELAPDATGASIFAGGGVAAVSSRLGRESQCQARPPIATAASAGMSQPNCEEEARDPAEGLCVEDAA